MKKAFLLVLFAALLLSPVSISAQGKPVAIGSAKAESTEGKEFREKLSELKEAREEARDELKAQTLSRAKTLATKSIDRIILKYNRFITVLLGLPNVSDAVKAEYKTKIENEIARLTAKKSEITSAATTAEVKAVMATVKAQVKSSNNAVKLMVAAIHKSHLLNIIDRLDEVIVKLEAKAAENEVNGEDMSAVTNLINSAKADLSSARGDLENNLLDEAKSKIKTAKQTLAEAISTLKDEDEEE